MWPWNPVTFSVISFLKAVKIETATNMMARPSAMDVIAIMTNVKENFPLLLLANRFARNNSVFNEKISLFCKSR